MTRGANDRGSGGAGDLVASGRSSVMPAIILREMALQIPVMVENASHLDHAILAAAIEEEMPGLFHARTARPGPAEFEGPGARPFDHDLRPLFRAWPLRIRSDVAQRLQDKGLVA
jgi:hypothetical protein